jgi:histidinol phosphatase-like PHP family hydrolase
MATAKSDTTPLPRRSADALRLERWFADSRKDCRGRISGSRAGVIANWDAMFEAAAQRGVGIDIDGDRARQDLDCTLGRQALTFGCVFALDSDAHTTAQLSDAETALAHARLAAIPVDRIVNCWPIERLPAWLSDPSSECCR